MGSRAASDILKAFHSASSRQNGRCQSWLDFGCGSGRVARHLLAAGIEDLTGVDVDAPSIAWLRAKLGDRFSLCSAQPLLDYPPGTFDVVVAISVFSHMDETTQLAWLEELARVLRPGGLLIASTHGDQLLVTRGDLSSAQAQPLFEEGFFFAPGAGTFSDDSTFHTRRYMTRVWGKWFELVQFLDRGLMQYQDLSVWAKPASKA
ncbi:MAG TPA: class I SAM-dependent methyltransferase [Thermoanaerobaculia bacterium]|nr:class I SAM-dependent methyltransferase [Thermoanaerobaculia bacterium]